MASFSDLSTIAGNANFQGRVQYATEVAAVNVYSEDPNTAGHPARAAFAKNAIQGGFTPFFVSLAVLTNATIAAEANVLITPGFNIPDADIQFAVNSLWNALSGV